MKLKNTTHILSCLRDCMKKYLIQAYIIPTEDEHLGEYSSNEENRRSFISGFTGSRGVAVVTGTSAALWTDGRYYQQAALEIDNNWTLMKDGLPDTPDKTKWLKQELPAGGKVGIDPFLLAAVDWTRLSKSLANFNLDLVGVTPNLVDEVWVDKRPHKSKPIFIQPLKFTGKKWTDKVRNVQEKLSSKSAVAVVLTKLDDIAWLLNLRGSDIEYHPLFYSYVIVAKTRLHLFIDEDVMDQSVRDHLGLSDTAETNSDIPVCLHRYDSILTFLKQLANDNSGKIWISEDSSNALYSSVPEKRRINLPTPVAKMKAVKNGTEIAAMRWAHIKDAVSLCEFFSWLEQEVPTGKVTELSAAEQLHQFKCLQENYMGRSFDFISSVGSNASIIHYKPSAETDRTLSTEEIYLCDTGAQFREGTTDVTRVLHFGTPSNDEIDSFTLVLKGHIAISNAIFPNETKGFRLDAFARQALWRVGLDYLHGTGHGVGAFLCVHEGPYGITGATSSQLPLEENMIISNEPGYYQDGQFGVRLESLVQVVKADTVHNFCGKKFVTFDEVTLVPLQRKLVNAELLTSEEIKWFNDYQLRCKEVIGAELLNQKKYDVHKWLQNFVQLLDVQ